MGCKHVLTAVVFGALCAAPGGAQRHSQPPRVPSVAITGCALLVWVGRPAQGQPAQSPGTGDADDEATGLSVKGKVAFGAVAFGLWIATVVLTLRYANRGRESDSPDPGAGKAPASHDEPPCFM